MFKTFKVCNLILNATKCPVRIVPDQNYMTLQPEQGTAPVPIVRTFLRNKATDCDFTKNKKFSLKDKKVLFVGGMGGIAYETCKELLTKNLKALVLADIRCDAKKGYDLQKINSETKLHFMTFDLAGGQKKIAAKVKRAHDHLGGIDVLVNGGGIINDRDVDLTIAINLLGLIETTMAAEALMSKENSGSGGIICYIASVLGLQPAGCIAVHSATKHGVIAFAKYLARPEHKKLTGISHIIVCPGATKAGNLKTLVGVDTFEMSKPISEKMFKSKAQTAEICGKHIVEAMQKGENGSVWMINLGKLTKLDVKEL